MEGEPKWTCPACAMPSNDTPTRCRRPTSTSCEVSRLASFASNSRWNYSELIVAQLAADTCQHGPITVSNFRDSSFDFRTMHDHRDGELRAGTTIGCAIRARQLHGRWLLIGAHTLPDDCQRRPSAAAS